MAPTPPQRPLVRLFGTPSIHAPQGDVPLAGGRVGQLLAYLALSNDWVSRDQLATLLWPDRSQGAARSNLRYVVLQVRRGAPAIRGFLTQGDLLRWDVDTDVKRIAQAVTTRDWAAALAGFTGELLSGLETDAAAAFVEWLRYERARLAVVRREAFAARLAEVAAAPAAAATLARQALAVDALDETALVALLRAQIALGQPGEARRAYGAYAERLAVEYGIEPSATVRDLAAPLLSAATGPKGPVIAVANVATRGYVGRRLELTQVRELMAEPACRLLTITGPGGSGKSTLARLAAPLLASKFRGGVIEVPLEDLESEEQIVPRLAATLGITLQGVQNPLERVLQHLCDKELLLAFDNAEHLPRMGDIAATLLREAASLKLLVTSRARLAIAGEWLLPLEGLPVPDRDESDPEVLCAYDAVKLFDGRARLEDARFDLAAQIGDVVELAHAVEGLPLALELAAAWVRLLPVREIVRELRRSLDVLEAKSHDRSLRASFSHSWNLLAPVERQTLARIAVFHGSFDATAARTVASANLPVLAALVDKSLVRAPGDGRFSLHKLIRDCALEQLDDARAVQEKHAEFYAQWIGDSRRLRGERREDLVEIDRELPNLRAAWQFAAGQRRPHLITRLAAHLGRFFYLQGRSGEGIAAMRETLGALDESLPSHQEAVAQTGLALASLLFHHGDYADGEHLARAALKFFRAARDHRGIAGSLNTVGLCLWQLGRYDEARVYYQRALRLATVDGDARAEAQFAGNLAIIEKVQGHYERAAALYETALARNRQVGDEGGVVVCLNNLGNLHRMRRDWSAALPYLEEGLRRCKDHGYESRQPFFLVNLALTYLELGDAERGLAHGRAALRSAREVGSRQIELGALLALARAAIGQKDLVHADALVRETLTLARLHRYTLWDIAALGVYAETCAARGERIGAAALWQLVADQGQADASERTDALAGIAGLALSGEEQCAVTERRKKISLQSAVDAILAQVAPAV